MTMRRVARRVSNIIEYEPSWFAESGSAVGVILWSVFVCLTDDFHVVGGAWIMPALGFLFGPYRLYLLFHLYPVMRVIAAAFGAIGWGWLMVTLFNRLGFVPGLAGYCLAFYLDILTISRFSLLARRARHPGV